MSRLLFAAARGARIMSPNLEAPLSLIWINNTIDHGIDYYIHPDDEHLQYGPISTALREMAQRTDELFVELGPTVTYIDWSVDMEEDDGEADAFHQSLFLLILAEALADEGL